MKESTSALLIAGGGLAAIALGIFAASRSSSSSNKDAGTGAALPPKAQTITRDSCLECVEKHLGAAMVLCAEERDGYPYRLRVIGHLHEAEDESQAWPMLHNAIRAARKHYQQTGQAPNFEALAQLTQAVATQAA
jgi:hypothetical protein